MPPTFFRNIFMTSGINAHRLSPILPIHPTWDGWSAPEVFGVSHLILRVFRKSAFAIDPLETLNQ